MGMEKKLNIITNHLLLEKEKHELELERFLNSDEPIETLCTKINNKLNNYRNADSNIKLWLEFVDHNNEEDPKEKEV